MLDFTTDDFANIIKRYIDYIIIYGLLLLGLIKAYANKKFQKLFSVLLLLKNKKKIQNHEFFTLSFSLYEEESFNNITSVGKKLIVQDVARIEFKYLKFTVANVLKFIYDNKFTDYYYLHSVIETELKEYRDLRNSQLRKKFDSKFVELYIQNTEIYYQYILAYFKTLMKEKSVYQLIVRMLDIYFAFLVTYKQTIPYKINKMNGSLSGITYRGHNL